MVCDPHKLPMDWIAINRTQLHRVGNCIAWTQDEALESLLHKGGHRGALTSNMKSRIQLTRYQSSKCTLTYQEYRQGIEDGSLVSYLTE
jgi:hypothetical protein